MRRYFSILLILLSLPLASRAQERDWGSVSSSFESNSILYMEDPVVGKNKNPYGSNNYLKVDWLRGNLSAGLAAEYYPEPLSGYPEALKGAALTGLYAAWNPGLFEVRAGSFYEQIGSGLLLRSWEDRELGINNPLVGGNIAFRTKNNGLRLRILGGAPLYCLHLSDTFISAGDVSIDIPSIFGVESPHSFRIEGSIMDRTVRSQEENISLLASSAGFTLPSNILSWSGRLQYSYSGLSLKAEYVGKGADFTAEHLKGGREKYDLRGGSAALAEINYAIGSFSVSALYRRLENMYSPIFQTTGSRIPANTLNYLPSLCMQQTYLLAGLNPYVTYADGESGFQGDIYYSFKKGTALGGKYGMKFHVGGSCIDALPSALPNRDTPYLAYRDINIDLEKVWSRKFRTVFFVSIQENSPTHGNRKATDAQNVFVVDGLYKFTKKVAARLELQYLYSEELTKDWMAAVAEVTFAPHWSISFSDMYNHGSTGNHYYQGGVAYSLSGLNVSLNFGRTREGYVCSGGVCRWQPAYKGANLRIQWAF